jgi:hypothetical protein
MRHFSRAGKRKKEEARRSAVASEPGKKSDPLLDLHGAIGNKGVAKLLQDKFQISKPGDPLEQEADRLAAEMIASPESAETSSSGSSKQSDSKTPDGIRSEMGRRLGTDLSDVKINDGSAANSAADKLGARAFTSGSSIGFGKGEYAPGTTEGRRLIAHELAHAGQQKQGRSPQGVVQRDEDPKKPQPPKTPYDKVVVDRAKKKLDLLKKFVTEYTTRAGRKQRSTKELDKVLKAREKMDTEGDNPFAEIEKRGELEKRRMAALNKQPVSIDVSETEIKFHVKFHVRFEDPKMEGKFGELKSSLVRGIDLVWNKTLTGDVFGGRRLKIEPEVVKIAATAARDQNYWLITVRSSETGSVTYAGCKLDQPPPDTPTSVTDPTCDGGVMSIPPSHISMPDILGHELLHLFGFVDRYMMKTITGPGKKPRTVIESTRKTGGRPDPLGAETGPALSEDLAFLLDNLGVYEMEESRGLDTLRDLESKGMTLTEVQAEIHRQEEIIQNGYDPHSLLPIRKDFTDKVIKSAEDLD